MWPLIEGLHLSRVSGLIRPKRLLFRALSEVTIYYILEIMLHTNASDNTFQLAWHFKIMAFFFSLNEKKMGLANGFAIEIWGQLFESQLTLTWD